MPNKPGTSSFSNLHVSKLLAGRVARGIQDSRCSICAEVSIFRKIPFGTPGWPAPLSMIGDHDWISNEMSASVRRSASHDSRLTLTTAQLVFPPTTALEIGLGDLAQNDFLDQEADHIRCSCSLPNIARNDLRRAGQSVSDRGLQNDLHVLLFPVGRDRLKSGL